MLGLAVRAGRWDPSWLRVVQEGFLTAGRSVAEGGLQRHALKEKEKPLASEGSFTPTPTF